jgi:hypothetical protein
MGLPSLQQIFYSFLFLFRYMFRSFDHLQVRLHNTEKLSLSRDPLLLGYFSCLLAYIVLGKV